MFKRAKGTKPIPKNARAVGVARDSIEALGATMQQTLNNAITGDGRYCLLYMPKTSGLRCTCSSCDPLNVDGKMHEGVMSSILNNSGITVTDYDSRGHSTDPAFRLDNDNSKIDNSNLKYPDASPAMGSNFSTKVFTLESLDADDFDADSFDIQLDVGLDGDPSLPVQNNFNPGYQFSSSSCPICLGTGWVGGYDLYSGNRQVFAASSATSYNACEFVDSSPDFVRMPKDSSLEFADIVLPAGANRVDEISMWNRRNKVAFNLWVDGALVDLANFPTYFDGRHHNIKLAPTSNTEVTHIVFQYGTGAILADVSKDLTSTNNSVHDQQNPVSVVLPIVTSRDLKGAIIYDSTDDIYYRISSVSTSKTQGGYIQSSELDGRVVQPYELAMLLPKMNLKKIKKLGGSFGHASIRPRHF